MPLYYRSDTRPPKQIFEEGFIPRVYKEGNELWWVAAIRAEKFKDKIGVDGHASDANSDVCACMAAKLESTAIFPLNKEDETYIYVMAMPEATKVLYVDDAKEANYVSPAGVGLQLLNNDGKAPEDMKEMVIDLHSLQATQAGNLSKHHEEKKAEELGVVAGWPLHAYEAIAAKIPKESIVAAIKVKRFNRKHKAIASSFSDYAPAESTEFRAVEFFENKNQAESYQEENLEAKKELQEMVESQKSLQSTNIYYGLGGKILPVSHPVKRTFDIDQLEEVKVKLSNLYLNSISQNAIDWDLANRLSQIEDLIKLCKDGSVSVEKFINQKLDNEGFVLRNLVLDKIDDLKDLYATGVNIDLLLMMKSEDLQFVLSEANVISRLIDEGVFTSQQVVDQLELIKPVVEKRKTTIIDQKLIDQQFIDLMNRLKIDPLDARNISAQQRADFVNHKIALMLCLTLSPLTITGITFLYLASVPKEIISSYEKLLNAGLTFQNTKFLGGKIQSLIMHINLFPLSSTIAELRIRSDRETLLMNEAFRIFLLSRAGIEDVSACADILRERPLEALLFCEDNKISITVLAGLPEEKLQIILVNPGPSSPEAKAIVAPLKEADPTVKPKGQTPTNS